MHVIWGIRWKLFFHMIYNQWANIYRFQITEYLIGRFHSWCTSVMVIERATKCGKITAYTTLGWPIFAIYMAHWDSLWTGELALGALPFSLLNVKTHYFWALILDLNAPNKYHISGHFAYETFPHLHAHTFRAIHLYSRYLNTIHARNDLI